MMALVRLAWCSMVEMDLLEVATVRGRLGSELMLREECVCSESWLILSSSGVVFRVVVIAWGRMVGKLDVDGYVFVGSRE